MLVMSLCINYSHSLKKNYNFEFKIIINNCRYIFSRFKTNLNIHWSRIVVHGVPIGPFATDEGLVLLKDEIETFNPQLKLMKKPSWLISEENRQYKMHASIVIAVENIKQASFALHNKLCIAGLWLKTQKYENSTEKTQCQNCQKWGHTTRLCKSAAACQICAGKHATY